MFPTPTFLGRLLPATVLMCVVAGPTLAQTADAGRVSGQIKDESGQPLVGATVVLRPSGLNTVTNAQGEFELSGVPAGTYTVTTTFVGYRTATQTVQVSGAQAAVVAATLAPDALLMSDVVVTGTFNPQSKLESSTSVTTLDARQIQTRVARGTADLLMAVPGFRVNSDGGEAANSVSARGLPVNAESGFGFLQLMEDGLPLLETGSLTFAKSDIHLRLDETINRLEVVRGGSAGVQANNAPGGIINFLSKTGTGDKLGGTVKFTGGDQGFYSDRTGAAQLFGLQRYDANFGGPIKGTPLRFNIGGFYRYDVGTRYAGYPQNVGGQVKANVTYTLKNGYVRLYGKYLNDRVAYLTSIPYQNLNHPEQIPGGPDLRRGTMYSQYQRYTRIPDPFNNGQGFLERDLADGQHSRYKSISSEVYFDLGHGFSLQDNARYLDANLSTDGVYDLTAPLSGFNYAYGRYILPYNAAYNKAGFPGQTVTGYQYSYADDPTNTPIDVTKLNGNGLINIAGIIPDDKPATNYINKLQLNKTVGRQQLSGGFYASRYTIKERISYNFVLQEVANRPRLLNLVLTTNPAGPLRGAPLVATQNGFAGYSSSIGPLANTTNTTQILAGFFGDTWKLTDQLTLDLGLRYEHTHTFGHAAKSAPLASSNGGGLDNNPLTIYDNTYYANTKYASGNALTRDWDFTFETVNFSGGVNYLLDPNTAVYGRYSTSGVVPTNDQFAFGPDPTDPTGNTTLRGGVQRVQQAEVGVKSTTGRLGLGLTAFYSRNSNIPFTVQQVNPDGSFTLSQQRGTVRSAGLEAEITFQPARGLTLRGIGTVQAARIVEFQQLDENNKLVSIAGNRLEDTPDLLLEAGAEYNLKGFDLFANYRYFGDRYANRRNTILLPQYGVLFGGLGYNFAGTLKGLRLSVQGSNILNALGYGDAAARNGENSATTSQAFVDNTTVNPTTGKTPSESAVNLVRPILPRNITASVGYSF